jgi:hypothetical protein
MLPPAAEALPDFAQFPQRGLSGARAFDGRARDLQR